MTFQGNDSCAASLIGDPVSGLMLNALLDGRAHPAGEFAFVAGVTSTDCQLAPPKKLLGGGLVAVETEVATATSG